MTQSDSRLQEKEQLLISSHAYVEKMKKQIKELVELRLNGELNSETLAPLLKPLEIQVKQLEDQIPELESEVDFLKIEYLSSETVLNRAKELYSNWVSMPFEEKRNIIELITNGITISKSDINISLSYLPTTHPFLKAGKSDRSIHNMVRVLLLE